MIPSLEGWPTKVKEAPSPHEVRLSPMGTNPVFLCLGNKARRNLGEAQLKFSSFWKNQVVSFIVKSATTVIKNKPVEKKEWIFL